MNQDWEQALSQQWNKLIQPKKLVAYLETETAFREWCQLGSLVENKAAQAAFKHETGMDRWSVIIDEVIATKTNNDE